MKTKQKGVVLVLCLAVLLFLSTTAVSFLKISTYERKASDNYYYRVQSNIGALGGMEHAKALIFNQLLQNGRIKDEGILYPHNIDDLRFDLNRASTILKEEDRELALSQPIISAQFGILGNQIVSGIHGFNNGELSRTVAESAEEQNISAEEKAARDRLRKLEVNSYSLKIINLAGRLNVNSHISSDASKQIHSNTIIHNILVTLAQECGVDPAIIDEIRAKNNQVTDHQGMADIEKIVLSPNTPDTPDTDEQKIAKKKFLSNICAHSWMSDKTDVVAENPVIHSAKYYREQRAPIDINSVSLELLTAVIANIKASALFFPAIIIDTPDQNFTPGFGLATETEIDRKGTLEVISFADIEKARSIAEHLLFTEDERRSYLVQSELDSAIDEIPLELLPDLPDSLDFGATLENTVERFVVMWKRFCRDALKSNFNPNTIENFWNADLTANYDVTKAFLFTKNNAGAIVPTHTTELCFSSNGRFEIESIGRLTNANGNDIFGQTHLKAVWQFADIIIQTTQADFINGNFTQTISYPDFSSSVSATDTFNGYVQPITIPENNIPQGLSLLKKVDFTFENNSSGNTIHAPENDLERARGLSMMQKQSLRSELLNHRVLDGLISTNRQYLNQQNLSFQKPSYFPIRTLENKFPSVENFLDESEFKDKSFYSNVWTNRTDNILTSGDTYIANYQGLIEMWVKLDVAGDDPIECGLLSISQTGIERLSKLSNLEINEEFADEMDIIKIPYKEGIQMMLTKNTAGQLRLSRLYFAGFFDSNENFYGTKHLEDADPNRKVPRRDVVVDVSGWKAHTWHHIVIHWNDRVVDNGLRLIVDGSDENNDDESILHEMKSFLPEKGGSGGENSFANQGFCILAEKDVNTLNSGFVKGVFKGKDVKRLSGYNHVQNTMEGAFILGIPRLQKQSLESAIEEHNALFKHGEEIDQIGNATIDQFMSYDAQNFNNNNFISFSTRRRFPEVSSYSNSIEINTKGTLGPLRWTSYPTRSETEFVLPFVKCTATHTAKVKPESDPNAAPKPKPKTDFSYVANEKEFPGFKGEGLPIIDPDVIAIGVQQGDSVEYTFDFDVPLHQETVQQISGGVAPVLEQVELMILKTRSLDFVYIDK